MGKQNTYSTRVLYKPVNTVSYHNGDLENISALENGAIQRLPRSKRTVNMRRQRGVQVAFAFVNVLAPRRLIPCVCQPGPGVLSPRRRPHVFGLRASLAGALPRSDRVTFLPSVLRFDKVPDKLPDWWDEDDDADDSDGDDDDDDVNDGNFGSRGGGSGGSGRNDGNGDGNGGGNDGDPDYSKLGPFGVFLTMFTRSVAKYPLRTKAVSTGVLAIIGDLIAQRIAWGAQESPYKHDVRRTLAIGIWGFVFMGPVLHTWYGILNRYVLGRFSVLRKVVFDQTVFAPLFNSSFFFGVGLLEGQLFPDIVTSWRSRIWSSMLANWSIWPIAQAVNFLFVPLPLQIVYVNCVAVVWNAILTYISHNDVDDDHDRHHHEKPAPS